MSVVEIEANAKALAARLSAAPLEVLCQVLLGMLHDSELGVLRYVRDHQDEALAWELNRVDALLCRQLGAQRPSSEEWFDAGCFTDKLLARSTDVTRCAAGTVVMYAAWVMRQRLSGTPSAVEGMARVLFLYARELAAAQFARSGGRDFDGYWWFVCNGRLRVCIREFERTRPQFFWGSALVEIDWWEGRGTLATPTYHSAHGGNVEETDGWIGIAGTFTVAELRAIAEQVRWHTTPEQLSVTTISPHRALHVGWTELVSPDGDLSGLQAYQSRSSHGQAHQGPYPSV